MNIDLRKNQITGLVKKHYYANDFLKDKPLQKFIEKAIEKFLYTDLSIEVIEEKIIEAINRKKEQAKGDDASIEAGEDYVDPELDNTKIAINITEDFEQNNSDFEGMLDNIDNTSEVITEAPPSNEDFKIFTLSNQSYHNPSNKKSKIEGGYADTIGISTISLIAFTVIMILYVLLCILF